MSDYLPILVMAALVVAFVMFSFIASQLLAPKRPNAAKQAPYECGIVPEQEPAERFSVKFYLVAMGTFVLVLLVPFAYLLSVGALDWGPVKEVVERLPGPVLRTDRRVLDPAASAGSRDTEEAA